MNGGDLKVMSRPTLCERKKFVSHTRRGGAFLGDRW